MQMKKIYLAIAVLVLMFLIFWLNGDDQPKQVELSETSSDESVNISEEQKELEETREHIEKTGILPEKLKKQLEMINIFHSAETSELNFYGQLLDQDGAPIINAKVSIGTAYYPMIPRGDFGWETEKIIVKTNHEGRFVLDDLEIVHFSIEEITRQGYDFKGRGMKTFKLNQMTREQIKALSSQENPYTITGWKRGESEPLISTNKRIVIEGDGRFYTIDYENGWIKEGKHEGDIYISLYREFNPVTEKDYPWSFTLEANQGGVQQTDEHRRDVYVAPEAGYIQNWAIKYPSANERWKDVLDVTFFVKSRNGKNHAVISLGIRAAYSAKGKDVVIFLRTRTNPNHSRNLQYSKNKTKKVGIRKKH